MLWAGNTVSVKLGGTGIAAWHANLIRFLIAWPILAATSSLTTRPTRDDAVARAAYRGLVPVSLAEACVGASLFVYGLAHTDLAVGATLSSLAPLMSVPFALLYREERWSPPRFAAVTATVAGVIDLDRRRLRRRGGDMELNVHLTSPASARRRSASTSACSAATSLALFRYGDTPGARRRADGVARQAGARQLTIAGQLLAGADVPGDAYQRPRGFYLLFTPPAPPRPSASSPRSPTAATSTCRCADLLGAAVRRRHRPLRHALGDYVGGRMMRVPAGGENLNLPSSMPLFCCTSPKLSWFIDPSCP